jgi:hypothetical protein
MTRECHVRFCERLGVRLPGATLPGTITDLPRGPMVDYFLLGDVRRSPSEVLGPFMNRNVFKVRNNAQ